MNTALQEVPFQHELATSIGFDEAILVCKLRKLEKAQEHTEQINGNYWLKGNIWELYSEHFSYLKHCEELKKILNSLMRKKVVHCLQKSCSDKLVIRANRFHKNFSDIEGSLNIVN